MKTRSAASAARKSLVAGMAVLGLALVFIASSSSCAFGVDASPAAASPTAAPPSAAAGNASHLIVRLYYGDRARLNELVARHDVFEAANHAEGYVEARLSRAEYDELRAAGYRVEIDQAQTDIANTWPRQAADQFVGIPGFPCYRTVEETFDTLGQLATNYPGLATLVDIGDSWDKLTPGGAPGFDLRVLVLSNKSRPGPKPRFFLMAEHHARELTTTETATRFAEELATGYGVDPDITWLLDYHEIHILPMANPDGRKWAELGYFWRKNTNPGNGCTNIPGLGTDLNRNLGHHWGLTGSSPDACSQTYRGPAPFSEPENQAIRDYVRALFPDQRGPLDTDAAPANATGLVISLHSYSQLVLYPWGWTTNAAPNAGALRTLGGRFGYFNRYTVQPSIALYITSGTMDDWVYGELGVACFTFELGTAFFEACTNFQSTIYPSNRPALFYAAKACRQPYLAPAGPDVLQANVFPASGQPGSLRSLQAVAASGRAFGYTPLPPAPNLTAARYTVDNPSWIAGTVTHALNALDGSFNSSNETIVATLDTTGWSPGRHTVFIEAQSVGGDWGVPTAVFVTVEPILLTATLQPGGIVLRWPSVTNKLYTLLASSNPLAPYSVLASNLPAQPPANLYTDAVRSVESRFYRVRVEP